ncbi:unnamed protein product [Cercopithifilaria johnstoni]|uniref:Uncharacterized protein n=1 Tax=Cercopithifilaria johnstoni TaxID=2874296 RepID=A0A8J2PVN1_9BILA|nr:unnamed protein product [Cercopithifilaria johnstoni]
MASTQFLLFASSLFFYILGTLIPLATSRINASDHTDNCKHSLIFNTTSSRETSGIDLLLLAGYLNNGAINIAMLPWNNGRTFIIYRRCYHITGCKQPLIFNTTPLNEISGTDLLLLAGYLDNGTINNAMLPWNNVKTLIIYRRYYDITGCKHPLIFNSTSLNEISGTDLLLLAEYLNDGTINNAMLPWNSGKTLIICQRCYHITGFKQSLVFDTTSLNEISGTDLFLLGEYLNDGIINIAMLSWK